MSIQIQKQLDRIEASLVSQKSVLNVSELSIFTGLSKSCIYKLTSTRKVPFSCPNGKTLFFDRVSIEEWLLSNPSLSQAQINRDAVNHVVTNPKFGGNKI